MIINCPVPWTIYDAAINEYGYGSIDKLSNFIEKNSYAFGLYPNELGIYLNDYEKLDSGNFILYFAYFATEYYIEYFKYYLHLIIRDIYFNKKHKRKRIFLILPGLGNDINLYWNMYYYNWNENINEDKKFHIKLEK